MGVLKRNSVKIIRFSNNRFELIKVYLNKKEQ